MNAFGVVQGTQCYGALVPFYRKIYLSYVESLTNFQSIHIFIYKYI